jgi:hypothetical protein
MKNRFKPPDKKTGKVTIPGTGFMLCLFFFSVAALLSGPTPGADTAPGYKRVQVYPFDKASENPSFKRFRDRLITAVKQRDLEFLLKHIDDGIQVGFGQGGGSEEFVREWKMDLDPGKSRLWKELAQVIRMGGAFQDEEKKVFFAPYTFLPFPGDSEFDSYFSAFVTGSGVRVRSGPSSSAPAIARLSYDAVKWEYKTPERSDCYLGGDAGYCWKEVAIYTGQKGYVYTKYLRSPIDYRAGFEEKDGVWKMVFFIAGD